ncbi:flagella basal body P-ring formation protein FlgA [Luteimonas chenhongjianii]|uniref:Flagella basal body P-ring formation protein FlgA n=1 Tax=Luteimonas chenhongjianii TaxID=2006110 RepID=A0A290XF35_9GAMM|nr:flagellar basal body P-ring formation chaperone FlgA [Luteimonas chenhongjianii]ATD67693.1 flagella basal body P-ring formation protein FlgA [Luteimonas chenhongjianii]
MLLPLPTLIAWRRLAVRLAVGALLAAWGASAVANPFQPVESIRAAALSTAEAGEEADASLDPALRMPRCAQALQARRTGAATVEVACPEGWRLFVPLRVRRQQSVLVLSRSVAAGEAITADTFMTQQRDATRIAGAAIADPAEAIGRSARRTLVAGSVLTAGDLVTPRLVRRGDTIALVSSQGGIEVRMAGRALADAGVRERVSVENLSSRRVVQGTVDEAGDVRVGR